MGIDEFNAEIKDAANAFLSIDKKDTIRIISHLDCDGICAASILIKALSNDDRKYSISIVHQLNDEVLDELASEEYTTYMFTDLGSGKLNSISRLLSGRKVFILDHHEIEESSDDKGIVHVNPHKFGIDGSHDISGSGVVYLFAKALSEKNKEMAHIAIIGAIGDIQEDNGFSGINKSILQDAIDCNKISVNHGLRFFGSQTRPLHKLLEYSTDPYIPGVSGSESAAIQFLSSLGINPKTSNGWVKMVNLSDDELKKLAAGIIIKRAEESNPEDIFGDIYLLNDEEQESPLKDAREFSTLLNSCGRMNKASIGIGTCLGRPDAKRKAIKHLSEYKKEIVGSLRWFDENKDNPDKVVAGDGYIIINAGEEIRHTIIGTLASILSKSPAIADGTFILSLAQSVEDDNTKVSLRIAKQPGAESLDVDLRLMINRAIEFLGTGESGGHANAAGAMIPSAMEPKFLEIMEKILAKNAVEEVVR